MPNDQAHPNCDGAVHSKDLLGDGNELYCRALNECLPEHRELMVSEWSPTPWMIDVSVGERADEIRGWCCHHFGRESSPMHGSVGIWRQANVTMMGRSWFGFASEAIMERFKAEFQSPNGGANPVVGDHGLNGNNHRKHMAFIAQMGENVARGLMTDSLARRMIVEHREELLAKQKRVTLPTSGAQLASGNGSASWCDKCQTVSIGHMHRSGIYVPGCQHDSKERRLWQLLKDIEMHCPCGARPESPNTHPHVGGCPVDEALRLMTPNADLRQDADSERKS